MQLEVLAFGIARDIVGGPTVKISLEEGINLAEFKLALSDKYPQFDTLNSLYIAINNEYGEDDQELKETDEIALIPPVSGG